MRYDLYSIPMLLTFPFGSYGGKIVVVPYWVHRSPAELLKLLESEKITVLNQTPSIFKQLLQAHE